MRQTPFITVMLPVRNEAANIERVLRRLADQDYDVARFEVIVADGCSTDATVASAFKRSGADCLGRPQPLEIDEATPVQQAIATARRCWLGHNPSSFIFAD